MINVSNAPSNTPYLTKKEASLLALTVAINEKYTLLKEIFAAQAREEGATESELAAITAIASLMNTNNVFYRFRHFMQKGFYNNQPAGIKMSVMMNPVLGKEFFEPVRLVISAINGCEMCVSSHEQSVLQHDSSEAKVYEAVKTGAVVKGLITVHS